jgi:dephospho-CoA kinase
VVVAGLTGGIATGKSTVAGFFLSAGAVLIDADRIAFDVVQKGTSVWREVIGHFGEEVLLPNGQIDRISLGKIIFNDGEQKRMLDKIVHPAVFDRIDQQLHKLKNDQPDKVVILDIPLLIETGMYQDMSDIIVVYVPPSVQIERLIARDGLSRADALSRISSQMSIEEKKNYASIIIDNRYSLKRTKERTLEVYQKLKSRT